MNTDSMSYLSALISLTPQNIYLVGGSVRDLLIGKEDLKDIDLVIPSGSGAVARAFSDHISGNFFFLDEERNSTRVVKKMAHGVIQFDFMSMQGPDLAADLRRRDFSMNAMALDLREFIRYQSLENIIDLFRGKEDVINKLVRVTHQEVLNEDPLRLLRAVRFAVTLGFTIEESTAAYIRERSHLIAEPSPERLRDEIFLILSERNAGGYLELIDSLGLLLPLLPELAPLRGFTPGRYQCHDVLTHSIRTAGYLDSVLNDLSRISPEHAQAVFDHLEESVEHLLPRKAALRFACLLHDLAKPETFTDTDGHIRFHGHDFFGAEKAALVCRRFRMSRDSEALVAKVIKQHMRLFTLSTAGEPGKNALYRYCRDLGPAVPESLLLAQADARATYEIMPKEEFSNTEELLAVVLDYYYSTFLKTEAKPLVNGQDLIDRGLEPGPRFGEILDEIKERQALGMLKDRQEALKYLKRIV